MRRLNLLALLLLGHAARGDEIKVAGADEHKLKREGAGWSLRGPGVDHFTVMPGNGGECFLRDTTHHVVLHAQRGTDGTVEVHNGGAVVHRVRFEGEQYRLLTPDGALVVRVKVKRDKFNVYDAGGRRVRHGKAKPDGFSVKDEAGTRVDKIKGVGSLREASFFALGIDFGEEALLFCAGNG